MLLYHGSLEKVEVPVLDKSKESNDFGKGFYLTSSKRQALKWAKRNMRINDKEKAYISVFNFISIGYLESSRTYQAMSALSFSLKSGAAAAINTPPSLSVFS